MPSAPRSIESDLISRWITPSECKYANAFKHCLQTVAIWSSSILKKKYYYQFKNFLTKINKFPISFRKILDKYFEFSFVWEIKKHTLKYVVTRNLRIFSHALLVGKRLQTPFFLPIFHKKKICFYFFFVKSLSNTNLEWVTISVKAPPSRNSMTTQSSSSTKKLSYISTMLG